MEDVFKNAVKSVADPVYLKDKSELVDYYKDTYGEKKWTRAAAEGLYGLVKNKKGENVSVNNIQRRFQGERLQKEGKGEVYKQLGEKLPPSSYTPKSDTVTVRVRGEQSNGRGGTRKRVIDVKLKGSQAYTWVNQPNYSDLWSEYGYGFDEEDDEYGLSNVTVTAS